jgi:hypothetical protein
MSEDLGLLKLSISPILERVAPEDRLNGDPPRRQGTLKPKPVKKPEAGVASDEPEGEDDFKSSNHIDLRI